MKELLTKVKKNMSDEEKYEIFNNNKKEIISTFSDRNSFFGIDKVRVKVLSTIVIDENKIRKFHLEGEEYSKIHFDRYGSISEVIIKSDKFGKFFLGKNPYNGEYYSEIEMIHGGLNFETISVDTFKIKAKDILNEISLKTGIEFENYSFKICEIELAWTLACFTKIELQVRSLLMRSLTQKKVNFETTNASLKTLDYDTLVTNAYKNNKQVLYSKIQKAIKNKQIESEIGFEVYRFETVLKKQKIKKVLGTDLLSDLTDKLIIQYLESYISLGVINFIKEVEKSVNRTDKVLLEISKNNIRRSFPFILAEHINYSHETNTPFLIDEETFSLLDVKHISIKNRAKCRNNLIRNCRSFSLKDKKVFYLTQMVSWQTLLLFKLMFESLEYAKLKGLGCHKNIDETKLHLFKMTHFDIESRDRVYRFNNKSRTKNHSKIDLYRLVLERLVSKDRDIF